MIDSLKTKHPLQMLCNQLNVSISGYLAHLHNSASQRKQRDQRLITHIRAAHEKGRGSYGPNKIQTELVEQNNIYLGINNLEEDLDLTEIELAFGDRLFFYGEESDERSKACVLLCTATPEAVWPAQLNGATATLAWSGLVNAQ